MLKWYIFILNYLTESTTASDCFSVALISSFIGFEFGAQGFSVR